jgi:acyl carrier protein
MICRDQELVTEVANLVLEAADAHDVDASELTEDSALIGPDSRLGLDSLDSLEITFAVKEKYGAKIDDRNTSLQVLRTLGTLCDFIAENRQPA